MSKKNGQKTVKAEMRKRVAEGMDEAVAAAREDGAVVVLTAAERAVMSDAAGEAAARTPHTRYVEVFVADSRRDMADAIGLVLRVPSDTDRIVAELRPDDVLIADGIESAGLKAVEFIREIQDRSGCGMVFPAAGDVFLNSAAHRQFSRRISRTVQC